MSTTLLQPAPTPALHADAYTAQSHAPATTRIAFLLSQYPAVSHTFLLNEVIGLRARGLEIETVSINPPDRPAHLMPELEVAEAARTAVVKTGHWLRPALTLARIIATNPGAALRGLAAIRNLRGLTLRKRLLWLAYLAEALLVGDWMRSRDLRHLHVHFGGAVACVGLLTSLAWNIPYSLTIHGPEELLNTDSYRLREKLRRASFVYCISDFCRSQLCQLLPPSQWSKLHVIRLGVDPARLLPADNRPAASARLRIICTGRLVPAKGHAVLLDALADLAQRGIDFEATLIGNGPERKRLELQARALNLTAQQLHFASALAHPQTLAHVRNANIFVLASFAEGLPVALMEAMSMSVPCVSTTIAAIPELITCADEGLLVPPSNALALADALHTLAVDPALRHTIGCNARQRVIRDYNLPLNHERLAARFIADIAAAAGDTR